MLLKIQNSCINPAHVIYFEGVFGNQGARLKLANSKEWVGITAADTLLLIAAVNPLNIAYCESGVGPAKTNVNRRIYINAAAMTSVEPLPQRPWFYAIYLLNGNSVDITDVDYNAQIVARIIWYT